MYRTIITPDKKNHSIEMPEEFFGKRVEVIVTELSDYPTAPAPPPGKRVSAEDMLQSFGANPDFPSIEEIRAKAWPSKW